MKNPISILSTKKLLPNQKQYLLNAGFSVVETDFIQIKNKDFALENINDNLIFTSQNAVKAVSNHPKVQDIRRNPVFCVGEKTADLLDEFGFTVVESSDYGSELAKIITTDYAHEKFTFFSGNLRLETIPSSLKTAGMHYNEIEVYDTILQPQEMKTKVDAILFFSPSGVESFLHANNIANEMCFCIGTTTAKAVEKVTNQVMIATQPTVDDVIVQAIKYYNETKP